MIQAIDYTALNDLAMKALAAKERILKATQNQPPSFRVVPSPVLGETPMIMIDEIAGDPADYKIIHQWQCVIIAFGQLEFEQVRRALEEYKCQNS